jgi:hypothetical protein
VLAALVATLIAAVLIAAVGWVWRRTMNVAVFVLVLIAAWFGFRAGFITTVYGLISWSSPRPRAS